MAAVKSRHVLQHGVIIFFWSSGIMECTCMLFTFENGVWLMPYGASVVWHHSLLLMNSFNKTDAAVFSCRLYFLRAIPFISLICINMMHHNNYHFGDWPAELTWHKLCEHIKNRRWCWVSLSAEK